MNDPSLGSRGLLRSPQSARGGDGRGRKDYEGEGLREGGRLSAAPTTVPGPKNIRGPTPTGDRQTDAATPIMMHSRSPNFHFLKRLLLIGSIN